MSNYIQLNPDRRQSDSPSFIAERNKKDVWGLWVHNHGAVIITKDGLAIYTTEELLFDDVYDEGRKAVAGESKPESEKETRNKSVIPVLA